MDTDIEKLKNKESLSGFVPGKSLLPVGKITFCKYFQAQTTDPDNHGKIKGCLTFMFFALVLPFFSRFAQSNIPVGSWKFHQSYKDGGILTGSDQTVFCQGSESLFYFSTENAVPYPLTRNEGLYGQSFAASGFDPVSKTFLVAYPDGTLDRIGEKSIETVTALRDNNLISEKKIHGIKLVDGGFYLASAFGLARMDPATGRFLDAFINIGPDGSTLPVKDIATDSQHLYLATFLGILKGDLSQNLKDFRNWKLLGTTVANGFEGAENLDGQLFFLGADQQLYFLNGDLPELVIGTAGSKRFKSFGNAGYFLKDGDIYKVDASGSFSLFLETDVLQVSDFHLSGDDVYLSIPGRGVVRQRDGAEIFASGPQTKIQQFHWDGQGIFAFPVFATVTGEFTVSEKKIGSKLANGIWSGLQAPEQVTAKTNHQNAGYFGTHGNGLWREVSGQLEKVETDGRGGEIVWAFAKDSKNQLWVGFGDNQERLLKIDPAGNVGVVPVPGLQFAYKIIVDSADNLWVLQSSPSGIPRLRVFNEETNVNRQLGASSGQGAIPAGQILDLDLDLEDNLWLGLNDGIVYLPNVSRIQTGSEINAVQPLFDNRNLLTGQKVKAVLVAPDQTKWFGTENNGLWHFSEYGDGLLDHLTRANSPLSSNSIKNLHIDPISGELLIVLPDAALSYRGRSIKPEPGLSSLKIFPNPVRPDFTGFVSIEGLTDFAVIKIATTAGRVVFSDQVRGGKATWNLRSGESGKVPSGVYLVYVLDDAGAERVAGKFVVL